MSDFVFKPGEIVQRPYQLDPWASPEWQNNATWIKMRARKIVDQLSSGRGGQIAGGEDGATFLFLAPPSFGENIGHTWSAYDSIQTRIAEKAIQAAKLGRDAVSLVEGAKGFLGEGGDDKIKSLFSTTGSKNYGTALESVVRKAYNSTAGHSVPKIKVDKPLIYTDSQRRQLILQFELVAETNPKNDILDVIQDLMKYSSAGISSKSNIDIEFPYFFEVTTVPGEAINYKTCALQTVQPTWNPPWRNGFPGSCSLQLSFQDISPLFRQTIESGSLIRVISPTEYTQNEKDTSAVKGVQRGQGIIDSNAQRDARSDVRKPASTRVGAGSTANSFITGGAGGVVQ